MRRDAGLAGVRAHGRRTRFRGCFAYALLGLDPDPDERGPPTDWDLVDPPAPET